MKPANVTQMSKQLCKFITTTKCDRNDKVYNNDKNDKPDKPDKKSLSFLSTVVGVINFLMLYSNL